MFYSRPLVFLVLLLALLLMSVLLSLSLGSVAVPLADLVPVLTGQVASRPGLETADLVIWQIRMPRVCLSLLVGACLALSGAMVQGLFRNPLADPSLIGVSGGAAVGAAVAIVLGGAWPWFAPSWNLPLFAFIGGTLVTALVYRLGVGPLGTSVATMLLAGVAINAMTSACISYLATTAEDVRLRNLVYWLMGSFNVASWEKVVWVAPFTLLSLLTIPKLWRGLNALLLGESEARHLGIRVERLRFVVIVLAALTVGVSVASVGVIGFVGLVVPHIVRLMLGPDHRWLLPGSALLGAALLSLADLAARLVVEPLELPVGVLTAVLGAPFFLFLVTQRRRGQLYGV
ncbi:MAG: ABC transporter permease [Pseudomonadales bacterium]|jgi:iron complex transport system permease protein|nr:ABC transporter permease [Pseudomonadales bacterium]MEC8809789.1 iron ABC transporter permease [Pseudomonadota bacterium]TNC88127.1 MAG: ABC transporter permease [Alcanivorax sp.]HAG96151.1 ABC transporter permease [Gammaproteobacteria bacterium]MAQ25675.1 ABC transporter permease [Pseudomonadales bacterium]|tara:strand:+ start:7761 stop:8795 length:1035 start_codon:yes stop_codon:yes gene_type:complete